MGAILKPLKVLVLGHRGFIGHNLTKHLRESGYEVRTINRDKDLTDYNNVVSATRGIDWCFSLAADMGGVGYFNAQNYYPVITNYLIDLNVLRACERNKVKRLFYPASACAYSTHLMNEGYELAEHMLDYPAEPDQMYGWEKLSMIKLMRQSPVDCRVGVLHTIYGNGQAYEGPKAKFPPQIAYKAIRAVKTGEIEVWGDGTQTRTFLHIEDAIKKIMAVMSEERYWGEVNIGSDKEVSVNEVVELCCNILKIKPEIKHLASKPTGPKRRRCSNAKFHKHYGDWRGVSLKEGFTSLINYINGR
jgi:GDP-D-mannose 3', 5'-epimerase